MLNTVIANAKAIPDLLRERSERSPAAAALMRKGPKDGWYPTTWHQYAATVSSLSEQLACLGLSRGDRVGILSASRPEWDIAQMAVLCCGGVAVGLDRYDTPEHISVVASQAEVSVLLIERDELLERISEAVRAGCKLILTLEARTPAAIAGPEIRWPVFPPAPEATVDVTPFVVHAAPDDPAIIVFTSGTTGQPKGITYTHGQVLSAVASILDVFDNIAEGTRLACWLPLSNLFQRMINFCAIAVGAVTYYVENPRDIGNVLSDISPQVFIGVPRFYEKLYAGIMAGVAQRPWWQRKLIHAALLLGDSHARCQRLRTQPSLVTRLLHPLADHIVLNKLRSPLGGQVRYMVSGSAAMPVWLLERFHAMGLLILEAYGLSENIVPVALNRPAAFRFGTVGQPLRGNDVSVAEDGQLLVRGPGVFHGYLGEGDRGNGQTPSGYLTTGDIGEIDSDGFITLRGRMGDLFKTSTGRRISPLGIEERMRSLPCVEHALIVGAGRAFLVGLIAVSAHELRQRLGLVGSDNTGVNGGWPVGAAEAIRADVEAATATLPAYHRPAALLATTQAFTLEGGEITANLKLRRKAVESEFADQIDALYREIGAAAMSGGEEQRTHMIIQLL